VTFGPARARALVAGLLTTMVVLAGCGGGGGDDAGGSSSTTRPTSGSPGCVRTGGLAAGDAGTRTIDVGGTQRTYALSSPRNPDRRPADLVVLLHGLGSSAADVDRTSDLPSRGARKGSIVATPNALGAPALWQMAAQGRDADFLDALIDEIESTECVDRSRVYIAGFSAGAGFAGAYACARADRIAAIATVAVE
jgi:polyhydroxybutyrate depolymerase